MSGGGRGRGILQPEKEKKDNTHKGKIKKRRKETHRRIDQENKTGLKVDRS
jgi:hypothetical protein